MKVSFLFLLILVLAVFPIAIKKLILKKDSLSVQMKFVLLPAFLATISHIVTILATNERVGAWAYSFYFSASMWISVLIFNFCIQYAVSGRSKKIFNFVILPIAFIDTIAIFANLWHDFMFSLYFARFGHDYYLRYIPSIFLLFHVAFSQFLFIVSFSIILRRIIREPPLMRVKYYSILTFLFAIEVANLLYFCLNFPFNFTIFVYAICFVLTYHIVTKFVPDKLIQKTLGLVANNLKSGIILLDNEKKCIYVNSFIKKTFKCDANNVLNLDFVSDFMDLQNAREQPNLYRSFDSSLHSSEFDYRDDEKRLILRLSEFPILEKMNVNKRNSSEEKYFKIGSYFFVEDITVEKNELYEQRLLLTCDPLTRLYNKEYFTEKIEQRLKFDSETQYYLLISDIVNFKLINDLHGKPFGDMLLVKIAEKFRSFAREDDIYARLFNDHFALLMPKRRFDEEAFVAHFAETFTYLNNFSYSIVWHVGIYEIEDQSLPISVMCDRAFLALNSIKNDYKNCIAFYDETLRSDLLKMQTLMNELPQAIQFGELKMYLQPQFTKDGNVLGAEALVRWHHPEKGLVSPSDFIQVIEKINMISDVDRFVWRSACQKLAEWKAAGKTAYYISVNISPRDFYTMDLYANFTSLVREFQIDPKNLKLEITETAVIMDLEHQISLIDRLRAFGFTIEMDDFGSGYSSLNMLKDITVDVLKIDMAFLQKSQNDKKSRIILQKIIMLAKELDMTVVTEGVEKQEQIEFLSEFGCDLFQGYFLSKPIPANDFEEKYLK